MMMTVETTQMKKTVKIGNAKKENFGVTVVIASQRSCDVMVGVTVMILVMKLAAQHDFQMELTALRLCSNARTPSVLNRENSAMDKMIVEMEVMRRQSFVSRLTAIHSSDSVATITSAFLVFNFAMGLTTVEMVAMRTTIQYV